jgi:hypothetical protein
MQHFLLTCYATHRYVMQHSYMSTTRKVNKGNLRMLCWTRGYRDIAGLARSIKRNRVTVHRAVARPDQFGPTYHLIEKALAVK